MSKERESLQMRLFSRTQEVAGIANALSSCYVHSSEKEKSRGPSYPWMSSFPARKRALSLREEISEALKIESGILLDHMACLQEKRKKGTHKKLGTIIRNLMSFIRGLENDGVIEKEYLELFKQEILLFQKDWKRLRRLSR